MTIKITQTGKIGDGWEGKAIAADVAVCGEGDIMPSGDIG